MPKNVRCSWLFNIFTISCFINFSYAQTFFYSDTLATLNNTPGRSVFGMFDIESCSDTIITPNGPVDFVDVTFYPNGDFIGYGFANTFSSEDGMYFINHVWNFITFLENTDDDSFVAALTCDYNGTIYAAGEGISTFDLQNEAFNYLGDLPLAMQAGGDLTYREGKIYLTTINNALVEVNLADPVNSTILTQFPPDVPLIEGLATFPYRCDSIVTYAIGQNENGSIIYHLDFENYSLTEVCQTSAHILGAATEIESTLPPCELFIDLDQDNSSGETGNNFRTDTICITPVGITDQDLQVFTAISLDSIRLELSNIQDIGQESLILSTSNNIIVSGSGTNTITLINQGNSTLEDFENALRNIVYENTATINTLGERQINLIAYAMFYSSEPSISYLILENPEIALTNNIMPVSCFGENDGAVTVETSGGTFPYNYFWEDGANGPSLSSLSAGFYLLTITDFRGCNLLDSIYIPEPNLLEVTLESNQEIICGNNGSISTSVSGGTMPYNYLWENGIEEGNLSNISAGVYTVSVFDNNNCLAEASISLDGADTVFVNQTEILCQGNSFGFDGNILTTDTSLCLYLTATNGCDSVHCLDLQFLDSVLVQEYSTICQGETLEIDGLQLTTDTALCLIYQAANGCDSTYCVTLEVLVNETNTQANICEGETYDFNGQQLSQNGTYTATYPGSNGCDSLVLLELTVAALPDIDLYTIGTFCMDEAVQIQGGNHTTYIWSTGENSNDITVTSGGTYHLTVTNEAGCLNLDSISLSEDQIDFIVSTIAPSCFGESDGQIIIDSVWGGQAPYIYSINDGPFQETSMISGLDAGNYTLVAEDTEGCRQETMIQIEAPAQSTLQLGNDVELSLGDSVTLKAITNFTPTSIQWTPQEGLNCDTCLSVIAQPINSITYRVTAIDGNNCIVTDKVRLVINRKKGIYVPTAFSPNNDGINDAFTLYSNNSVEMINSFRIFDRWGGLAFEVFNIPPSLPAEGWNGKIDGQNATTGVYVYSIEVIRIDGKTEVLNGEILLIR